MSQTCRTYIAAGMILTVGVTVLVLHFDTTQPWFYIGNGICAASIVLGFLAATCNRRHSIDEAFEAGYTAGYRRGRRVGKPTVIHFPQEDSHGRVPKAPVREVAGEHPATRRPTTHAH